MREMSEQHVQVPFEYTSGASYCSASGRKLVLTQGDVPEGGVAQMTVYAEPGKGAIHGAKDLRHGDVYLRLGLTAEAPLNAPELMREVYLGVRFEGGERVTESSKVAAA